MTVKELIDKLSKLDQDKTVCISYPNEWSDKGDIIDPIKVVYVEGNKVIFVD